MKFAPAAVLLLAALPGFAQEDEHAAQQQRIRTERAAVEQRFEEDQKACRARFAVTDCMLQVRRDRNTALADLRRQEIALNDAQRRIRSAARQRELDERAAERDRKAAEAQAAPPAAQGAPQPPRPQGTPRGASGGPGKPQPQGEARAPRIPEVSGPTAAEAAKNRAEFEQRRQEAEAHKAQVRERLARRSKPAASALPLPQ